MSDQLLKQLVDLLAEQLAPRVAELVVERLPAPTAEEPWHLLNVEEVAARLGRSTRWVRDRKHLIGPVRLDNGPLAFHLEDVQRFARERRIACRPLAAVEEPLHLADSQRARRRAVQKAGAGGA